MKYLKCLFLLLFFIPFAQVKAQTAIPGKDEVIALLCHKWRAIQMEGGGRKITLPPNKDYMLFKTDFTYEEKQDDHIEKGKWQYNEEEKKIIFSPSGHQYPLKEISASKLVLVFKIPDTPTADVTYKKIAD